MIPHEWQTYIPEKWRPWMEETIRFYCNLGYFPRYANVPLETAARDLYSKITQLEIFDFEDDTGANFESVVPGSLEAEERVFVGGEIGCFIENTHDTTEGSFCSYVLLLDQIALSSRGIFLPEQIREDWNTPVAGGPLITFSLDGTTHHFHIQAGGGYDIRFLSWIDQLLERNGYSLLFLVIDQATTVDLLIILNPEERKRLETERGLTFQQFEEWSGQAD